jgi:hypothetical protein
LNNRVIIHHDESLVYPFSPANQQRIQPDNRAKWCLHPYVFTSDLAAAFLAEVLDEDDEDDGEDDSDEDDPDVNELIDSLEDDDEDEEEDDEDEED